jgi:hypothetical protein
MGLKHLVRRALLAVAFAVTGCTVTTSSSDSCSPDSTVVGCTQGSTGYSCTGLADPAQASPSLNCSTGVPGNAGSMLFCCVAGSASSTTCAPDITVTSCPTTSQGYSCTGSDTPPEGDPSLSCGPGAPGNAGSTLYCCVSNAGADSGSDVGVDAGGDVASEGGADASNDALASDGANDAAASDGGNDALVDAGFETGDGGTCAIGADTGSPSCDQCVDSACCTALVACGTPDDAGSDDAGASACEQLLQCTLDCLAGNPDAGLDAGSLSDCQAICNPSYTLTEQQNANALIQCQATNCAPQCQ